MSKKKKIIIIVASVFIAVIVALIVLSIFANNELNRLKNSYDENGNHVISSNGSTTTMYKSLPATLQYNDKTITLTEIDAWQTYEDYSYSLFVKATFDISKLSDTEIHWLVDEDFTCTAYATNEKNNIDFKRMVKTDWTYNDKTMTLLFSSSTWFDSMRHSFDGSEITICADAKQEETYEYTNSEGKTNNLHTTISFQCKKTFDAVPLKDK